MSERLAFNVATRTGVPPRSRKPAPSPGEARPVPAVHGVARPGWRRRAASVASTATSDWGWRGLIGFTAVLFIRPQDQLPPLAVLHLAELFAVVGLTGMILARVGRGLPAAPFTPEIGGLLAFGGAMLVGLPFSFWPGGSAKDFVEIYLKVLVIVVLMIHCLDRVERIDQFISLIVVSSGFVAIRSLFDYLRGVHLVEGGRLGGAIGGIFGNPNDLALNMVVFLPFAIAAVFKPGATPKRLIAAFCALLMLVTLVLTKSRGGFLGLAAMVMLLVIGSVRVRPAIGVAAVVAVLAAVPLAPASFWGRMVSILDQDKDTTGSRQARLDLMKEGVRVFAANPVFGIGLGQFVNYNPSGRQEAWNVTHNATLQVASELGVVGLVPFLYLIARAVMAARTARRALVRAALPSTDGPRSRQRRPPDPTCETLLTWTTALGPAVLGWIVCAQFGSVALNWTFYFVLGIVVATREVVLRLYGGGVRMATAVP